MKKQLNTVRADIIRPLLAATLALALTLTLGCEEKSDSKAELEKATKRAQAIADSVIAAEQAEAEEAAAEFAEAKEAAKEAGSCKGNEKVKLLASITDEGKPQMKFEYDEQNRIVKIYWYNSEGKFSGRTTITYNTDDLITVGETKYVKKGNTITLEPKEDHRAKLTLNENGYIAKVESNSGSSYTYEYEKGNRIGEIADDEPSGVGYEYDDKKSPFSNTNTPKWLLLDLFDILNINAESKNNVVVRCSDGPCSNYEYEYDSEGFPTKNTRYWTEGDSDEKFGPEITLYTYCGGGSDGK